jgi:hypothetical protein
MADTPEWAMELCEEVLDCIEGFSFFEPRYYAPDANEYGIHLIEIAPAKLEIAEAGEHDGEEVFDSNFDVDLLALKRLFGRVRYFHSEIDYETFTRKFSLEATYQRRAVVLAIRTVPFDDAVISGRLHQGGKFELFNDGDGEE